METIETLNSFKGRILLQKVYKLLKYENNRNGLMVAFITWKICAFERDLSKYGNLRFDIMHPLGVFRGSALWMEEIVNRFFYSAINSFVYFGAAVILVLVGMRRFSDAISEEMIIGGLVFEALLLTLLFLVMFFTPKDIEVDDIDKSEDSIQNQSHSDLLDEIGEVAREIAAASMSLEKVAEVLQEISNENQKLSDKFSEGLKRISDATSPNPEMIDSMKLVNEQIGKLSNNVQHINTAIEQIKSDRIELEVRKQIQRIVENTK